VDAIFIALPLQDHKGCIFYKKYVVARKCLRDGGVNPECRMAASFARFYGHVRLLN
jgi:hypothetical protein